MRRLMCIWWIMMFCVLGLYGQSNKGYEAIAVYLGADDMQEMDQTEVEILEGYLDTPLLINIASDSELRSSGLLSSYQVAVLRDYISRHGPIKSFVELSYMDGFGEGFVSRLSPFVSLKYYDMESVSARHEIATRASLRWRGEEGCDAGYGVKYRVSCGARLTGVIAASRSVGARSWSPDAVSGSIAWRFARIPVRIVAGDFNARFGQGLVLWNNSFITSLTTPDTFMKKPSGISQPWSFTGTNAMSGIAASAEVGRFQVSAMFAAPGVKSLLTSTEKLQLMPALNVAWYGSHGHVSLCHVHSFPLYRSGDSMTVNTGIDASFCIKGVNLFGELAYDWMQKTPRLLMGTRFTAGERVDMAFQSRLYLKDQYAFAMGGTLSLGTICVLTATSDLIYHPISKDKDDDFSMQNKTLISCELNLNEKWKLRLRLSERIRTWGLPFRTDARSDLVYAPEPLILTMRVNVLNCDRTGFLSYVEGGYVTDVLSVHLRQGVFFIDDWDDRIYVYERDAPGSFNVPAMYGRGVWTSATVTLRITHAIRLYLRGAFTAYPFMEKKKPGKAELKLQFQYRF